MCTNIRLIKMSVLQKKRILRVLNEALVSSLSLVAVLVGGNVNSALYLF